MRRSVAPLLAIALVGVLVLPGVALAGTESVYFYPDSDGWPQASLETTAPTYSGPMHDIDGNGKEGRRIDKSNNGLTETNKDKYQEWSVDVSGLEVTGVATFTVWFADKNFDGGDDNRIVAYLFDCGSSGCGSPLATAFKDVSVPDGENVFAQTTLTFPAFDHTFAAGRDLKIRLMIDSDFSDDDMTFAYDTTAYKTRLKMTKVVPAPTTTTSTTAPTTTTSTISSTTTTTSPTTTTTGASTTTTIPAFGSTTTVVADSTTATEDQQVSSTTTIPSTTTTAGAGGAVAPSTSQPPTPSVTGELDTEKTDLVIRTTPAQRGVFVTTPSVELTPVEGLMVSFLTAAETVRSQLLSAVGLGLIMASLLVIGLARRTRETEEEAG